MPVSGAALEISNSQPIDAVERINARADGPLLLLCEHASKDIPEWLNNLGLEGEALTSHVAWDPGAREVAKTLAMALRTPLIASRISRLVYDCNRPPEAASASPARSEIYDIPGNRGLSEAERQQRVELSYIPFCTAINEELTFRQEEGLPTALVTIHSFTPIYHGVYREVEIGILHDQDTRLADAVLGAAATRAPQHRIERNQPYSPVDGVTHSLVKHGIERGIPNVMIEIRNDLLQTADGIEKISSLLGDLLTEALKEVALSVPGRANA